MLLKLLVIIPLTDACRILSLSGGGAHGSFQAGVMNRLHDEGFKWDIVTGISVGSINGMMLSMFNQSDQQNGIKLIKNVWYNLTADSVYKYNWNPISSQSFLDSAPLNKTINRCASTYGGIAKRNVIIGAVDLNTGLLELFRTNEFNSPSRSSQIIMASSAIPIVFPPVFLDGKYYIDGGAYSNELIRPAINQCLSRGFVKTEIIIDIIICSPPIDTITNKEIYSDTIFGLMSRSYDILSNVISNHELYTECRSNQDVYPIYIYKPYVPYPGGVLDFTHENLVKAFKLGYNITKPLPNKYCY